MDNELIEIEDATIYKKDALSVVTFNLVYNKEDYEERRYKEFKPDMAHQLFGESETIYGYRSVSIKLFYPHNSLRCFVNVQTSGRVENENTPPDNIMECLEPWLQDYTTEEKTFMKMLENEKHDQIFGTVLDEFEITNENIPENEKNLKYKICLCDLQDDHFKEYHKRFETLIVWFIDAANFIDTEDERWMIFYIYEEFEQSEDNMKYISPVGFCSVYKFYAYPEKIRPRISQFFVLPTHQRRGLGTKLYHTILTHLRGLPDVIDVTVEEPTDTFQRIRDVDDYLELKKKFAEANIRIVRENHKPVVNVMKSLKFCKRQTRRLFDILLCIEAAKSGNMAYQEFIATIKNRMKADMKRHFRGSKRMNIEAMDVTVEHVDRAAVLETTFKKYISDIEPSIKYLQKMLDTNLKD